MDVQPPAPEPAVPADSPQPLTQPAAEPPKLELPKDDKQAPAPTPKQSKQPGNGTGLAIVATVVIVLGLAALATYAYLKTK